PAPILAPVPGGGSFSSTASGCIVCIGGGSFAEGGGTAGDGGGADGGGGAGAVCAVAAKGIGVHAVRNVTRIASRRRGWLIALPPVRLCGHYSKAASSPRGEMSAPAGAPVLRYARRSRSPRSESRIPGKEARSP